MAATIASGTVVGIVQGICGTPGAAIGQRLGRQLWDKNNPKLKNWWAQVPDTK